MAEVSAIVNSRPLVPVSTDPENPLILTPAMLLTQKTDYIFTSDHLGNSTNEISVLPNGDEYRLLPVFSGPVGGRKYLPLLQQRRKWTEDRRDLIEGDVILLKDKNICRTQWPVGIIVNSFKSSDEHVRKAEVRFTKQYTLCKTPFWWNYNLQSSTQVVILYNLPRLRYITWLI
ncbi:Hypothetical predicted protein [Mytilus galloprovincialis]|uniref:DUF5641 domain-containing protein n=1 Tax=Mytilus galloprovincialis TaxID=29158 RepID=A0A8B6C9D5_MYTGA|nr:Hypothetical predicted protein [Mytilus galloprovincialis]